MLYEVGGGYDTAGQEALAADFYEHALNAGLAGDLRRRCLPQYGSTLRNLGRIEQSLEVFADARAQFPNSVALGVFEALSLHAAGRVNTALGNVLDLIVDQAPTPDSTHELARYAPAIRGNADYLRSVDADADGP